MANTRAKDFNFEDSLEQLNQLVEQMEKGDLSLEDSMKAFEKGISLTRGCQKALKNAEQKVQILISKETDAALETFSVGDDASGEL